MNTDSLRNKIKKRDYFKNQQYEYQDIGSLIKEKRKELNLTQDYISNGICSISYLSKIENNQIMPNEYFVKEIMTKLKVDESLYQKTIDDRKYLDNLIHAIFYQKEGEIKTIYEDLKEIKHNMVINICKFGYVAYFNLDDTNSYQMMLENLVQNMDDFELKCFMLFSIMKLFSLHRYRAALDILHSQKKINVKDDRIQGLLDDYSYQIKQELHMQNASFDNYYDAIKIYQKNKNYQRIATLHIRYIENLSKHNFDRALQEANLIQSHFLPHNERDYLNLIKAKILIKMGMYQESTITLKEIGNESNYHFEKLVLLYEICTIEQDIQMKEELETILDKMQIGKDKIRCKIYYHYLKQLETEHEKEYLREVAIPFSIKIQDLDRTKFYTERIMDICINTSRYKEATQHFKKFQKEVNKIQFI